MAHKGRNQNREKRDTIDIATDSDVLRSFIKKNTILPTPALHLPPPKFNLKPLDDRRKFHPEPLTRPPGHTKRSATRLVIPAVKAKLSRPPARLPHQVGFSEPKHVTVCIRRKMRKQVLFAKGKTGKGARSAKHLNPWSSIKC